MKKRNTTRTQVQSFGSICSFTWLLNQSLFHSQQLTHRHVLVAGFSPLAMVSVVDLSVVVLVVALRRLYDQCLQHHPPMFHCENAHENAIFECVIRKKTQILTQRTCINHRLHPRSINLHSNFPAIPSSFFGILVSTSSL